MAESRFIFDSADEAATARLAAWLGAALDAPALIFLNGDLGAGKTAFARGFIRALHGQETQVPSPTFALVQPYDGPPAILHADLYRLGAAEELDELGIMDALADHICLIEWAQNGAGILPAPDINIHLAANDAPTGEKSADDAKTDNESRIITLTAAPQICAQIEKAAARDAALSAFLAATDWHAARRAPLAGDASTRRYERLHLEQAPKPQSAVLMDWQKTPDGPAVYDGKPYSQVAHLAEAMPRFADMVGWLRQSGLAAPQLYALDRDAGFALLEDFGDRTIAANSGLDKAVFYFEAVETLLHLHAQEPPDFLPAYDGAVQAIEASLFTDWYLPYCGITPSEAAKAEWHEIWQELGASLMDVPPVTVLRDYHCVNLIWRDHAQARHRIGLIDVQDALQGHAAYDLASLLYDARLDVAAPHRDAALAHYLTRRFGDDKKARARFGEALAICTMQRNLKIAGIFIRLAQRDAKPAYLAHMPRIIGYLKAQLEVPCLKPVADWLHAHAPHALNPSILDRDA
jgi:tRNA threonylcarbamoyl adenosine modification protein YjeE